MNIKVIASFLSSLLFFSLFYFTLTGESQRIITFQGPDNEIAFASIAFVIGVLGFSMAVGYYEKKSKK
jgi:hypothetical protein